MNSRLRRRSLLRTTWTLRCVASWQVVAVVCCIFRTSTCFVMVRTAGGGTCTPADHVPMAWLSVMGAAAGGPGASGDSSVAIKVKRSTRNPVDTSQVQKENAPDLMLVNCGERADALRFVFSLSVGGAPGNCCCSRELRVYDCAVLFPASGFSF